MPRSTLYFNPRSREGSDTVPGALSKASSKISIHAPAKGATKKGQLLLQDSGYFNPRSREGSDGIDRWGCNRGKNFNPRSREGSDYLSIFLILSRDKFQSTLPRRERHCKLYLDAPAHPDFNPRSREGSDLLSSFN